MSRILLAAILAFGLLGTAHAQLDRPLYIVDEPAGPDQGSVLYRISPDSGAVLETVGDTGEDLLTIAVDPGTGEVIGLTGPDSANPDALVRISPNSGEVTQVLPLIMPDGQAVPIFLDMFFQGTFGAQRGLLFASAVSSVSGDSLPGMLSIDSVTGEVSTNYRTELVQLIRGMNSALAGRASVGFNTATMFGCVAGPGDSIFLAYLILGTPGPFPDPPPPFFEFELPAETCMTAGSRANGFTFFGVGIPPDGGVGRELLRVDLDDASATVTTVGPLPDNTAGIAFGQFPASTVPTLRSSMVLLLIGLMLVSALVAARRV